MQRLTRVIDAGALRAIMTGTELNLDDAASAERCAVQLAQAMGSPTVRVCAQHDGKTDKHWRRVERRHHGNVKESTIDAEFVHGADDAALAHGAKTFKGLIGAAARIVCGVGDRQKQAPVADFGSAMDWRMKEAEPAVSRQRYKGLGEMNSEQLWETTMDPKVRRLLRVQIEDAIGADQIFTTRMGDEVEPRRAFSESSAPCDGNLDVWKSRAWAGYGPEVAGRSGDLRFDCAEPFVKATVTTDRRGCRCPQPVRRAPGPDAAAPSVALRGRVASMPGGGKRRRNRRVGRPCARTGNGKRISVCFARR